MKERQRPIKAPLGIFKPPRPQVRGDIAGQGNRPIPQVSVLTPEEGHKLRVMVHDPSDLRGPIVYRHV
eukprot:188044-Alexandrium_andersonii.AAC.1